MQWFRYGSQGSSWYRHHHGPEIRPAPARTRQGTGTKSFKSGLPCSIEGCESLRFCRTWCITHYSRWQAHGDPLAKVISWPKPGTGKGKRVNGRYEHNRARIEYLENIGPVPRCECPKQESLHVRVKNGEVVLHSEADQARDTFTKHWSLTCSVEGCKTSNKKTGSGQGFCKRHYRQMQKHGRIISVDPIPLSGRRTSVKK